MSWIQNHVELELHVKFKRLVRELRPLAGAIAECAADGVLSRLWKYAFIHVQDGNLSSMDNSGIADACGWGLDADSLVNALVSSGFLDKTDDGLVIHEWLDHMNSRYQKLKYDSEYRAKKRFSGVKSRNESLLRGEEKIGDDMRGEERIGEETEEKKREEMTGEEMELPLACPDVTADIKPSRTKKLTRSEMPLEGVPCDPRAMGYISEMKELLPNYVPNEPVEMRFIQDMTLQYPEIDIVFEFSKAKNWIKNHLHDPKVRSRKLLLKFLTTWIEKAQEYKNERKAAELKAELEAQMPMFVPDDDEMSY